MVQLIFETFVKTFFGKKLAKFFFYETVKIKISDENPNSEFLEKFISVLPQCVIKASRLEIATHGMQTYPPLESVRQCRSMITP